MADKPNDLKSGLLYDLGNSMRKLAMGVGDAWDDKTGTRLFAKVDSKRDEQPLHESLIDVRSRTKEIKAYDHRIKEAEAQFRDEGPQGLPHKIDSFIRGAGNAVSFGMADKLEAKTESLLTGESYETRLAMQQARNKDGGNTYLGGAAGGAIATGKALTFGVGGWIGKAAFTVWGINSFTESAKKGEIEFPPLAPPRTPTIDDANKSMTKIKYER